MQKHKQFMQRALELAASGSGLTAPNPMVGCVIVCEDKIIGEGFHQRYGGPHAEVNAIASVNDQELLLRSTLYVTLEPCSHFGKTPPCSDLIIEKGIPHVVVAVTDPHAAVNGKGIQRLREAGIEVDTGVLEKEARRLNKRFFSYHEKKRPYIILKWAQTTDGFIDKKRDSAIAMQNRISGEESKLLVHKWRTEEQAILVGKNTVLFDDPQLTARLFSGPQPLRIVFDKHLELPAGKKIFNSDARTLILNAKKSGDEGNLLYHTIDWSNALASLMELLNSMQIQSLLVEGGSDTLQRFINEGLWDEMRIFHSPLRFAEGTPAPLVQVRESTFSAVGNDQLEWIFNDRQS
ncbi:MAG TPA: bifunctional diaminohydroxyphosphoribosylaminopyrimidine deaminase/5-amino-6-(5-phosphoribosylamino)uracil reductase RibD [Flavobacteriales bacterium]|nr:bifunctional diaminohydroxyphosphoribosylaminopyrimidine deaminase/5-amino-6-(5-phosphoribosylamino)uracil reductase RibD [Flavobacteriales bacterium]HRE75484.1 bifunctional diaminohydroxyphosphoribosylaminopyrimidine deaminase/5-amino-6-(5-phosphoribosylamino)uracil reductase RibD [Flavobacteriales bacterium]HRJ35188.1 bifunctional diaminohydroxyphosphoribosylaminopyrimidine deaminase/5-amino-6-(5-phosphoribosylamino)uracil reductase RibD [Flavobacteriales bacterium]HRJ37713.1 bifunctional d